MTLYGPTLLIVRRELVSRLNSIWFFAIATAACLIAWWYGVGFQAAFRTETVLVSDDPLKALNALIVTFFGFVAGLRLSASIAWEREHATIQVLLSGPATWLAIVCSKFIAETCVLLIFVVIYQAYLMIAQPLGAAVLSATDVLSVSVIVVFALPLISLGLLVSAWSGTVRSAVVFYLVLALLLGGFEVGRAALSAVSPTEASLAMLYLRAGVEAAAPFLNPMSAAAQIALLFESVALQTPLQSAQTLAALGLTLATLAASYVVARVRGAA